jgi:hypothetical protein
MIKLYRSASHLEQWVAYGQGIGWVMFPARENGWAERRPARGIDPMHLREAPVRLAANMGLPGSAQSSHLPNAA